MNTFENPRMPRIYSVSFWAVILLLALLNARSIHQAISFGLWWQSIAHASISVAILIFLFIFHATDAPSNLSPPQRSVELEQSAEVIEKQKNSIKKLGKWLAVIAIIIAGYMVFNFWFTFFTPGSDYAYVIQEIKKGQVVSVYDSETDFIMNTPHFDSNLVYYPYKRVKPGYYHSSYNTRWEKDGYNYTLTVYPFITVNKDGLRSKVPSLTPEELEDDIEDRIKTALNKYDFKDMTSEQLTSIFEISNDAYKANPEFKLKPEKIENK